MVCIFKFMEVSSLKNQIAEFPQSPGVYIFRDGKGKIVYIGKATNLKSRVSSYFRADSNLRNSANLRMMSRPIEEMIHQVADIKIIETDSVLEALILESNLIKKHQPKYNVKEKDDKSFSYFVITREEFPIIFIARATDLRDEFPISNFQFPNKSQFPISKNKNSKLYDKIFGPYTSKKQMEIALKIIRKIFPFHSNRQKTEKGCLDFQLGRCPGPYVGAISKRDYAKNIRGIQMILEGKKKSLLVKLEKEMQRFAKKEEFEKAGEIRNKIFALQHIQDVSLISKEKEELRVTGYLPTGQAGELCDMRIETYDISNISGQHAVGSMVVFENDQPNKKEYRKFKIKTVDGANDVAMMQEVLLRRFNNSWTQPDLILLDGGQGHLNMAEKLLQELGFVIPLVAVAKGPSRKNLKIQMTNDKQNPSAAADKIQKNIQAIIKDKNLVKNIMDEAHRFAIGYHRKLRKEAFGTK
ncbi:MAG: hypothetical protein COX30_00535 [Candidatus Moranbacteria bacterium CG23_combo_of_CG06-09_8_20_14_all_39_10]|nr:MAG: hypothetical protein COX30_00535 [Candidatus Moranbacteria bacterium CG23_combo_of_CG06-09_8_20_14_all_39_10]